MPKQTIYLIFWRFKLAWYTDLPSDWQNELEKKIGAQIAIEVIFDPDGINKPLSGKYSVAEISPITIQRDLDIEWAHRPTVQDVFITFFDPDGYFDSDNTASPFHSAVAELDRNHVAGETSIKLLDKDVSFGVDEVLIINDGENSEEIKVDVFVEASGATYYHEITYNDGLNNSYKKGTKVYTKSLENKDILIRLVSPNCNSYIHVFRGKLLKAPSFTNGKAQLILTEKRKYLLDQNIVGADTSTNDKLKRINTSGVLSDSTTWNSGSSGSFDRIKVKVFENAKCTEWATEFSSSSDFNLKSRNSDIGVTGKTELYQVASLQASPRLGVLPYINSPRGIFVVDDICYLVSYGSNALTIFNVSDATKIEYLSSIRGSGSPNYLGGAIGIYVKNNYAFIVSQNDDSFTIIDVSDKNNPVLVKAIHGSGSPNYLDSPQNVIIDGQYAYITVGGSDDGLTIYDISDPSNPSYVGGIYGSGSPNYLDGATGIVKYDNCVFIASKFDHALTIIDVSTPASPSLVSVVRHADDATYKLEGAYGIDINQDGSIVVIASQTSDALTVFDVSTPASPTHIGAISGAGTPNYLNYATSVKFVTDTLVCVSSITDDSLGFYEISNSSAPVLVQVLQGGGSPNYLDAPNRVFVSGDYIYVSASGAGNDIIVFRASVSDVADDSRSIQIPFNAWSGAISDGDVCTFATGISWEDENVIKILYDLFVEYAGIENNLLDCSSYFGAKEIGNLWGNVNSGDTTIKIKISVPCLVKTGETLTIAEGSTSEDVTVTTGNDTNSKYPPYISLDISALSNSYTSAATVTWKQRGTLDTDFTFDNEYNFCELYNYKISITLDRDMTYLQAIEEICKHSDCYTFADNWGIEKVHVYRPHYYSTIPEITKTNCLKIQSPIIEWQELVNEIYVTYGYNYILSSFLYDLLFPSLEKDNDSYLKNGFKRRKTISLPGVFDENYAKRIATHKYFMYKDGIKIIKYNATLKEILATLGDRRSFISEYPDIDIEIEIIGISINLLPEINIEIMAYDAKAWNDWFLIADSGIGTGKVLW